MGSIYSREECSILLVFKDDDELTAVVVEVVVLSFTSEERFDRLDADESTTVGSRFPAVVEVVVVVALDDAPNPSSDMKSAQAELVLAAVTPGVLAF